MLEISTAPNVSPPSPQSPISLLSLELLQTVLELVFETSAATLSSLALVSKTFYLSSRAFNHRDQKFTFTEKSPADNVRTNEKIRNLIEDRSVPQKLQNIRFINIHSSVDGRYRGPRHARRPDLTPDEVIEKWKSTCQLISLIPNLREISWRGNEQMPLSLLLILATSHPKAHLHIYNWSRLREDADHTDLAEITLAQSPNLRSIQARFTEADRDNDVDLRMAALKRVVALSPHLESVDISRGPSGCTRKRYTDESRQLEQQMGDLFLQDKFSSNSIKFLTVSGKDYASELDMITDFSKLERLTLGWVPSTDFFHGRLGHNDRFPALRYFSVTGRKPNSHLSETNQALESFLRTCNPLKSLSLRDTLATLPLADILKVHQGSLRALSVHETETTDGLVPRKMLSVTQLWGILKVCPLLEDIAVDINHSTSMGDTERGIFSWLAQFPALKIVRLNVDLGIAEKRNSAPMIPQSGYVPPNFENNPFHHSKPSWFANMWSVLTEEKKIQKSAKLEELHVKVGEWDRVVGGGLTAGWVGWESSNRRYFKGTPSDRDDSPHEIQITRVAKIVNGVGKSPKDTRKVMQVPELSNSLVGKKSGWISLLE